MDKPAELTNEYVATLAPARSDDGYKGTYGTALICAGSPYMSGAGLLSCGACLRSGCGMVRILSDAQTLAAVRIRHSCALLTLREGSISSVIKACTPLVKSASCVLIGPGLDTDDPLTGALLEYFIVNAGKLVIDAGAITVLAHCSDSLLPLLRSRSVPAVLTPHIGEFRRLAAKGTDAGIEEPEEKVVQFVRENKCVMVLKNNKTIIARSDGKTYSNNCGNSGLAKGGSGDVLAGLMTGFLAQGMEPFDAACAAVRIHSLAGMAAGEDLGKRAMLPQDIELYLPEAYKEAGWY
ncbi:MAG: NAD(P)H-hydrate dehydratase [Saccharofermentans sp.]|jgi:NAD(P)H-hydrate epimerase|nr:NAD(P)H-hydrate dehydratase [Mageeibacillus sp.]MCI1263506.1 NAD(P)H-hydrate dehydratase [Saccharofermentans sp.]MCI1275110.1 NAD(P)H-hydrate dehydratase [Saccharofermentans sp.]